MLLVVRIYLIKYIFYDLNHMRTKEKMHLEMMVRECLKIQATHFFLTFFSSVC